MKIYKDQSRSFEERAADLVSGMTLEEKISELGNQAAAIPRLDIPHYNYWSEASHGYFGPFKFEPTDVTSYPVCLAMSQSWDRDKVKRVAAAISDECRAYYNLRGDELNFWCPTINLARDPRNGRSDENFGEDPYLAGKLAASYIQGMQGDDEKYVKTIATPKHYALNSSENNRHRGSGNVDEATLREYYAKVFEYAIREGRAQSIMTSYNRVNGVPASCNDMLLTALLREEWGFDGFVVSDCGAVGDVYESPMFAAMAAAGAEKLSGHYYAKNMKEASAMTLIAGTDMSCGTEHQANLLQAIEEGLITEDVLDRALIRIFTTRFRLGLFDDREKISYGSLGRESICSDAMKELALDMANDTIVLLKNEKKLLPINKTKIKSVLVVGPNAIYRELGGYSAGSMSRVVDTPVSILALAGIKNELEGSGIEVRYEKGWCSGKEFSIGGVAAMLPGAGASEGDAASGEEERMLSMMTGILGPEVSTQEVGRAFLGPEKYVPEDPDKKADNEVLFKRALKAAGEADYVIVIAGTDSTNASEEHDRDTLELPYGQNDKIKKLLAVNDNTVVVLMALGAVSGDFFEKAHTVVNAHFAGQAQGTAIANVLFGRVNPNAKLSATWYKSAEELPLINDYGLYKNDTLNYKARTYMYFKDSVLFPFGYGLSYTEFMYSGMELSSTEPDANEVLRISVDIKNTGETDGAEIVELYVSKVLPEGADDKKPVRQLKAFDKVFLKAGETKTVTLKLPLSDITFWSNLKKRMVVEKGTYRIEIGKSSADIVASEEIRITGEWNAPLATVYVTGDKNILSAGETSGIKTTATLADAARICMNEYKPVYRSTDPAVLEVSPEGIVTAKAPGAAAVIAAVTYRGISKSGKIAFAVK